MGFFVTQKPITRKRQTACLLLSCFLVSLPLWGQPLLIGLNADMSALDAEAGEAIRRGAQIAINEINAEGGVLGRPLQLEVRDHRRNPARGQQNLRDLARLENLVAVLGGKHTPVVLAELELIHQLQLPYLIPWAAGTRITESGYQPNYVFRVSVKDAYAGEFLIAKALARGYKRPALLLERTGWGQSNERALRQALRQRNLQPVAVEFFNWGETHFELFLQPLLQKSPDILIFVGNAGEGSHLLRALKALPSDLQLPVLSHWGITGGGLTRKLGAGLDDYPLLFLQTFNFARPPQAQAAAKLWQGYQKLIPEAQNPLQIAAPQAIAHTYDLVQLLALAIEQAGTSDRAAVQQALLDLPAHKGVMRTYQPAFAPGRQDALDASDYQLACYHKGQLLPQPECPPLQAPAEAADQSLESES